MYRLLVGLSLVTFALAYSAPARADNIKLSCGACSVGSTSLISPGGPASFSFIDVANQTFSGDGFIVALVPNVPGSRVPTLTEGSTAITGTALPYTSGFLGTNYQLSSFEQASAQAGVNATSYTLYEFNLGNITMGPKGGGISGLTAYGLTPGTVVIGVLDGTTYQTPLSASITQVPEPASLILLGAGLLLFLHLGLFHRRGL